LDIICERCLVGLLIKNLLKNCYLCMTLFWMWINCLMVIDYSIFKSSLFNFPRFFFKINVSCFLRKQINKFKKTTSIFKICKWQFWWWKEAQRQKQIKSSRVSYEGILINFNINFSYHVESYHMSPSAIHMT